MPKNNTISIFIVWDDNGRAVNEHFVIYDQNASEAEVDREPLKACSFVQKYTDGSEMEIIPFNTSNLSRGYLAVFYTCLEELTILKKFCAHQEEPSWSKTLEYKTIEERYGSHGESYTVHKFDSIKKALRDTCIICNIIGDTYEDILQNGHFNALEAAVSVFARHLQDEKYLLEELHSGYKLKKYLRSTLIRVKQESIQELNEVSEEVNRAKLIYEDVFGFAKMELQYTFEWETARVEQKLWSINKDTQALVDSIDKSRQNIDNERRVHKEIELYILESIDDMNNQIDEWQEKYETGIEENEGTLIRLRNEQEILTHTHGDLKVLYAQRTVDMEQWLEYRRIKRIADALEAKRYAAATKIQAWWRGVMYRKHLGPYRKKGKKGNKGNKGNKGKNAAKAKKETKEII